MSKSRKIVSKPINKPYTRPAVLAKAPVPTPHGQEVVLEESGTCPYWGSSSSMFKAARISNPISGLSFIKEFESKMLNDKKIIPKGLNVVCRPSLISSVEHMKVTPFTSHASEKSVTNFIFLNAYDIHCKLLCQDKRRVPSSMSVQI